MKNLLLGISISLSLSGCFSSMNLPNLNNSSNNMATTFAKFTSQTLSCYGRNNTKIAFKWKSLANNVGKDLNELKLNQEEDEALQLYTLAVIMSPYFIENNIYLKQFQI